MPKKISRRAVAAGLAITAAALPAFEASAQSATNYPEKVIKLVIPFPPGGGSDFLGRLLAQKMSEGLKQTIIVDNKPGAAATIGADAVAKAAPDGYTLLMVVRDMGINPSIYTSLPYDTLKSFAWIGQAAVGHYVLVANPQFAAKSVAELVEMAKAKPGGIAYGSLGIGSMGHINVEAFKQKFGIDLLHVPYKGAGPALNATVAGEVPLTLAAFTGAVPFIREGRLRGLAVGSAKRASQLPDVPSITEIGGASDTLLPTMWGFAAPAGTPRPIIDKVGAELKRVLELPDIIEKIQQNGLEPAYSGPEALGETMAKDVAHFATLVKSIGITPQ
jgi:tripartite-type tricarboxylate transporter receptor subunit TctC